jgi:Asp-tRNA(Asn)/Glu-tRNA(Gln) amidotransferase A subunit family amidase
MSKASARDRLEQALTRIADPSGEGKRACLTIYADAARVAADAADARTKAGKPIGPLDGAIVSIKDLYDVAGEVTLSIGIAYGPEHATNPRELVACAESAMMTAAVIER